MSLGDTLLFMSVKAFAKSDPASPLSRAQRYAIHYYDNYIIPLSAWPLLVADLRRYIDESINLVYGSRFRIEAYREGHRNNQPCLWCTEPLSVDGWDFDLIFDIYTKPVAGVIEVSPEGGLRRALSGFINTEEKGGQS